MKVAGPVAGCSTNIRVQRLLRQLATAPSKSTVKGTFSGRFRTSSQTGTQVTRFRRTRGRTDQNGVLVSDVQRCSETRVKSRSHHIASRLAQVAAQPADTTVDYPVRYARCSNQTGHATVLATEFDESTWE